MRYDKPNLDQYIHEEEEPPKEEEKIEEIPVVLPQNQEPKPEGQEPTPGEGPPGEVQPAPVNEELAQQMDLLNQMGG